MELDGIMGTHFVTAVATDAVFGVDLGRCFVNNSYDAHRASVSAGATGYAIGLDCSGKYRKSIPEDRI